MTEREDQDAGLAGRVAELERTVARLERRVAELGGGEAASAPSATATAADPAPVSGAPAAAPPIEPYRPLPVAPRRPTIAMPSADPGQWVNRLGIALLLLGAAFGFKYSIDRGWIGPAFRVACGLAMSASLVGASTRLRASRPGLSRMLGGGGLACAYLSVFAAFQLYALVGYAGAFAAMSAVTAAALVLARRDDDAAIAMVGVIGGLATPFLLYTGGRNVPGLVGYTGLVGAAASMMFLDRGWRVLLGTTAVGTWAVMGSAAWQVHEGHGDDAVFVQAGILFTALATWWAAVMRELLSADDPAAWRPSRLGFADSLDFATSPGDAAWARQTRQFALATPVLVFALSSWTWDADEHAAGWIALSLAAGWAGAALHLRSLATAASRILSASHAAGAAVMVAFATALLLGDDARRVGLAAEALALLFVARAGDPRVARLGHLLFAFVSWETLGELLGGGRSSSALLGAEELSEAAVIALLFAAVRVSPAAVRDTYFAAAQAGLLMWTHHVLDPRANGQALTTAAWFANAVVLIVAGVRGGSSAMRRAGAMVMTLTMAKLFVYDMATVDAGWRIVTFLGFGAVLLGLGYAFPALWKREDAEEAAR
jgi:uncharacterized membrane protein